MDYSAFQLIGEAVVAAVVSALCALGGAAVLRLSPYRVDAAEALVAKYNRKAAKIGSEPIRLNVQGTSLHRRVDPHTDRGYWAAVSVVTVHGVAPRVAGWALIARVEHTEAGNLVSRAPIGASDVDLTSYRDAANLCDHCNTVRRRRDTFVLRNEEGALRRVGRNCLADFIRSEDLEKGLPLWTLLCEFSRVGGDDEGEYGPRSGGGAHDYGTLEFLAHAVAAVRVEGFTKSGFDGSTKEAVAFSFNRRPDSSLLGERWDSLQPTPADAARALVVRQWASTTTDSGDYLYNLRIATRLHVVRRNGGLLASAPTAYGRAIEGELAKLRAAKRPAGKHVGAVGERVELGTLTVIRIRHTESDWGSKAIVTLTDVAGNEITWFGTGEGAHALNTGDVLEGCKGTIKRHEEYKGRPQTTVSRLVYKSRVETKLAANGG